MDYNEIKALAKELDRPMSTLFALADENDPYMVGVARRKEQAEWFGALWLRFNFPRGSHIRRIHYVLISQEDSVLMPDGSPYLNTKECYKALNRGSRDARYLGLVSARDLEDHRNDDPVININDEATAAVIGIAGGLSDYTAPDLEIPQLGVDAPIIPQRFHVELWCEKSTMNDIILPLAERYKVNVITGLGELSLTRCVELVDRARASQRPVRILYISDFDAGGDSMPLAVARKIEFTVREEAHHSLDIQVRPVVLTKAQVDEYELPPTPMKTSERRAESFMERHDVEGATELDALEALHPGELARILEREIGRYYDDTLEDQIEDAVSDVQTELDRINEEVHEQHADEITELEEEHEKVLAAIAAFEEKARPILRQIEDDLAAGAPDGDSFDWPDPSDFDGEEDDDPLYDSSRDYIKQIERYKERQGKPTDWTLIEKVCMNEECGKTFYAKRSDARCCSRKCLNAYNYKRYIKPRRKKARRKKK